jgi:hypothetical protein
MAPAARVEVTSFKSIYSLLNSINYLASKDLFNSSDFFWILQNRKTCHKMRYGSKHIWNDHSNHLIAHGFFDISQAGHFFGPHV